MLMDNSREHWRPTSDSQPQHSGNTRIQRNQPENFEPNNRDPVHLVCRPKHPACSACVDCCAQTAAQQSDDAVPDIHDPTLPKCSSTVASFSRTSDCSTEGRQLIAARKHINQFGSEPTICERARNPKQYKTRIQTPPLFPTAASQQGGPPAVPRPAWRCRTQSWSVTPNDARLSETQSILKTRNLPTCPRTRHPKREDSPAAPVAGSRRHAQKSKA